MIGFSIEVVNGELVRMGLQKLAADVPKIGRLQIYRTAQHIGTRMRRYPPKPAGSQYIRTYRFKKSWPVYPPRTARGYSMGSRVHYAQYVVGDASGFGQALQNVHWTKFKDVIDAEVDKLPQKVEDAIQIRANAYGF